MARIDLVKFSRNILVAVGLSGIVFSLDAPAATDPNCLDLLKRDRVRILEKFGKLQNYKTYTPQKAAKLQAEVEKYLIAIGSVLENFNVDLFLEDQLLKIPAVQSLSKKEKAVLADALKPAFEGRRLPSYPNFVNDLRDVGLGHLPVRKIRDAMDRSFKAWRTKLVFDETGTSTYNRLAKAFADKMNLGEFSMQIGLLGKNEWEAFFEAEKGAGLFNPSMPGMMSDFFGSVEAHESVHMVVETLASQGHDSPYAVWLKVDKKFKRNGAIGPRQKRALVEAIDPLSDGDYYRMEMYLDEHPAHVIQAAYLNVQLSKALRKRYQDVIDSVGSSEIKGELGDVYADYLRDGKIEWNGYAELTRRTFEKFLATDATDGRTNISKLVTEMTEYMNWIDLLNDGGSSAVREARIILDEAMDAARKEGRKGIHPKRDALITIKPDVFLGIHGYRVEVRVPVDVLRADGTFVRTANGASVNFRFTNDGALTKSITPGKLDKLVGRMDWIAELAAKTKRHVEDYAEFLDERDELKTYTFADVFKIKTIHTRVRQGTRETLERIRASK